MSLKISCDNSNSLQISIEKALLKSTDIEVYVNQCELINLKNINNPTCTVKIFIESGNMSLENISLNSLAIYLNGSDQKVLISGDISFESLKFVPDKKPFKDIQVRPNGKSKVGTFIINDNSDQNLRSENVLLENLDVNDLEINCYIDRIAISKCTFETSNGLFQRCNNLNLQDSSFHQPLSTHNYKNDLFQIYFKNVSFPLGQNFIVNCIDLTLIDVEIRNGIALVLSDLKTESLKMENIKIPHVIIKNSSLNNAILKSTASSLRLKDVKIESSIEVSGAIKEIFIENKTLESTQNFKLEVQSDKVDLKNITSHKTFDISKSKIEESYFQNLTVNGESVFKGTVFTSPPTISNCTFSSHINFSEAIFKSVSADDLGAFRQLKHEMIKIQNYHDEILFSALELEAYVLGNKKKSTYFLWLLGQIYKSMNNYGRSSFLRPSLWLTGLFLIGTIANLTLGFNYTPPKYEYAYSLTWQNELAQLSHIKHAIVNSVYHTLGPLKLFTQLNLFTSHGVGLNIIQSLQMILSTIVWYLIIVGVRRQFKT